MQVCPDSAIHLEKKYAEWRRANPTKAIGLPKRFTRTLT
jgi:hypothetical protein